MPETHDLGRIFAHSIYLVERTRLVHLAPTQELDDPFRTSPHSLVVRLWPSRRGLVIGWWHNGGLSEGEALRAGIWAHGTDVLDDSGHILDEFEDWDV